MDNSKSLCPTLSRLSAFLQTLCYQIIGFKKCVHTLPEFMPGDSGKANGPPTGGQFKYPNSFIIPTLPACMDTGNLKALIQQVPWWRMSLIRYERVRLVKKMDESLYGVHVSQLSELTPNMVIPWEHIGNEHVTTNARGSTASTVASECSDGEPSGDATVWVLGAYENGVLSLDDLAFVILPQHLMLYRALTATGERRLRCRLIGSCGTGKSLACLYVLIRELAAGQSVAVLDNVGNVELMVWCNRRLLRMHNLPTTPCRDGVCESSLKTTAEKGSGPPKGRFPTGAPVGIPGADLLKRSMILNHLARSDTIVSKVSTNKLYVEDRGILVDELLENREDHTHCWTCVTGKSKEDDIEKLTKKHIRSTSFFDGLTTATRLTLSDEENLAAFKPPCYVLQTTVSLFTSAFNVPMVTEWYWPGVNNPVHVSLCRQVRNATREGHIDGAALEYVAGRNLRIAMLCHIMDSVSWSFTPVNNILTQLSTEALVDFVSPHWPTNHSWLQRDRRFLADCYLPRHVRLEYLPGRTCVGLLRKQPASSCIQTFALRRLVRMPLTTLYRLSSSPVVFNALVRQRLARSGIEIKLKRSNIQVNATGRYMVMFNDGGFREMLRRKSLYPETDQKTDALTREQQGDGVRYINAARIVGHPSRDEAEIELLDKGVRIGVWTSALRVPRKLSAGALERYDCCVFAFPRKATTQAFEQLKQCENKNIVAVWLLDSQDADLITDCSFRSMLRYWAGRYFGCD